MQIQLYKNVSENLPVKNPELLPFVYLPAYHEFIQKQFRAEVTLAVAPQENIFVLLSIINTKTLRNVQLLSEPFVNDKVLEDQTAFFEELIETLKSHGDADRIITPQNFVVFNNYPKGSKHCFFGSYIVDLRQAVEQLYANVHSKHRNKISKAERAGTQVRSGASQLEVFYDLYSLTMQRSSMYCEPKSFYQSLFETLTEKHCYCAVVYHNEIPQAAILAPYTKYCCYYVYGASADNITESGSFNFLHWHTFKEMKTRGVERYDFVGARLSDVSNTKLEGIQNFKERFGGNLKKGYLWKADLNVTKCRLYENALSLKNKLTNTKAFKDIIDQEIEKANS